MIKPPYLTTGLSVEFRNFRWMGYFSGNAKVDETGRKKRCFIAWIDNSPKALTKAVIHLKLPGFLFFLQFPFCLLSHNPKYQEASLKKDHATVSDEQRE